MEVKTATYSSSKKLSLSQKLKLKKHEKNDSKITLEFFCLKKKKTLNIQEIRRF